VFFPVNNVPAWMAVISKINPVTYGVDAIRQIVLGNEISSIGGIMGQTNSAIGVTVFGHTMTIGQDILVVVVIGAILLALAIWFFSRQE
jgi:ABC-2 type transport system permease protein